MAAVQWPRRADIMVRKVTIRCRGGQEDSVFFLVLGPMEAPGRRERGFRGDDEVEVILAERADKPDTVDLTFSDGEYALEVPEEYFRVLAEPRA
jgi:hypothetical protein